MDSREKAPHPSSHLADDEPPPFLHTWGRVYTVVVCYLACLIVLFYFFSRFFNS